MATNSLTPLRALRGAVVKLPEQEVLPVGIAAPGAGAQRVGEGEEHEQVEPLLRLDDAGEFDDGVLVVEVLAPGDLRHGEVVVDEEDERGEIGALQAHAARDAHRVDRAGLGVALGVVRLAGVVEQHGQVEDVGPRRLLQERAVLGEGRFGGVDDLVEHLDADEGVLVGGVTMEKFVLHQAGEGAELGEEAAEKSEFVHGAQGAADLPLARKDGQERFAHRGLVDEAAVDHVEPAAQAQLQLGAELGVVLLGEEKDAHEPQRFVGEGAWRRAASSSPFSRMKPSISSRWVAWKGRKAQLRLRLAAAAKPVAERVAEIVEERACARSNRA